MPHAPHCTFACLYFGSVIYKSQGEVINQAKSLWAMTLVVEANE